MDQEPDLSDQRPEEIQDQIKETRSDMTEKLEALEQKVMDTVADAKTAVADTVETVKESVDSTVRAVKGTVHETVASVKRALDVGRRVERHPWAMLGGSLTAGYVLGRLVAPPHQASRPIIPSSGEHFSARPEAAPRLLDSFSYGSGPTPPAPAGAAPSLFHELTEKFAPEIQQLKGLAIGALMGLARDMIKESVAPSLAAELERMIDRVTSELGGEPRPRPVLDLPPGRAFATNKNGR